MDEYELVVSEGKLPYWKAFLATSFLFLFSFEVYEACWPFFKYAVSENLFQNFVHWLKLICFGFAGMVYFATQKTVLIDLDANLLISKYNVGPVSWKKQAKVPELKYVSFFCEEENLFRVNLWYEGNKHYKMYAFEQKEHAYKFALHVAKTLKIDLLDASERGNSKWLEIDA